jgi:Protein of Unknown function (DUF2784)
MPWAKLLADFIVVFHAMYASFIVFGLVMILLGIAFRWGWVRNFWFRALHLTMIGPLTEWEKRLRKMAGEGSYTGEFIGYWVHRLIFYDVPSWVCTVLYIGFGLAVLATFVLAPPRWPRRAHAQQERGGAS